MIIKTGISEEMGGKGWQESKTLHERNTLFETAQASTVFHLLKK